MSIRTLVHETANAPGTNVTFTLAGPAPGRRSFAMAFPSGAPAFYIMVDGVQSEWGLGTVTAAAPNTLTRTTVLGNSVNTTARLNFTGVVEVYNALPSEEQRPLSDGPLAGLRNLLINGNPVINQRGYISGSAVPSGSWYSLDRWKIVTAGQAITYVDAGNARTVTAPAGGVEQIIEALSILGGVYTLSWIGSATATVNGAPVANGGQVTLPGGVNATVRFSAGTWAKAQLEPGTIKTPFEHRPIGLEVLLCQRYYWALQAAISVDKNAPSGGAGLFIQIYFPVSMRAAPTLLVNATGGVNIIYNGPSAVTTSWAELAGTSVTAGSAFYYVGIGTTFNAEIP